MKKHISLVRHWNKTWLSAVLGFVLLFGFCGCAAAEVSSSTEETATEGAVNTGESHILVACFSATGHTMPLAEYAADILGADLYEIVPEDPYTEEDLAYYTGGRCDQEQDDPDVRPATLAESASAAAFFDLLSQVR